MGGRIIYGSLLSIFPRGKGDHGRKHENNLKTKKVGRRWIISGWG